MSGPESEKLKKLSEAVPAGFLVDSVWMERHGIGRRSVYSYVKRGWLERVTRGVLRRPAPNASRSNTLNWKTCLLSLQRIMNYNLHIGGTTALSQQGYDHYLRLGSNAAVWVYGGFVAGRMKMSERALPETDFRRCVRNLGGQVRSFG